MKIIGTFLWFRIFLFFIQPYFVQKIVVFSVGDGRFWRFNGVNLASSHFENGFLGSKTGIEHFRKKWKSQVRSYVFGCFLFSFTIVFVQTIIVFQLATCIFDVYKASILASLHLENERLGSKNCLQNSQWKTKIAGTLLCFFDFYVKSCLSGICGFSVGDGHFGRLKASIVQMLSRTFLEDSLPAIFSEKSQVSF